VVRYTFTLVVLFPGTHELSSSIVVDSTRCHGIQILCTSNILPGHILKEPAIANEKKKKKGTPYLTADFVVPLHALAQFFITMRS
jgi:hypothetical protein